ncbi:hypothetical protein, partial [Staphylococcus aureus]
LTVIFFFVVFFKQKTAYEIAQCLVGSEMCIRDRAITYTTKPGETEQAVLTHACLLYTSPSPRDTERSRMPSSA